MEGQGEVAIISHMGLVVAHSERPELIGRHFKTLLPQGWESALATIKAGKAQAAMEDASGMALAFAPIELGRTGKPWSVLIRVPQNVVLAEARALDAALTERSHSSTLWQAGAGLGITLAVMAVMWLAAGGIARPIRAAAKLAEEIRGGDFSHRLAFSSADEVGALSGALDAMAESLEKSARVAEEIAAGNLEVEVPLASERDRLGGALRQMTASLNSLFGQVQFSVEQVGTGSSQVSGASQTLSQGATESASSLEQITASMSQLATRTQQNAENAAQADGLSNGAKNAAARGSKLMGEMVSAMNEIDRSGQDISKIIKVIDEIAFQTNLLALNAAVEAARAGQHGKGFAVVAEEVRNLAARSARAAKETADLIERSAQKTRHGSEIAEKTAAALKGIVAGAGKVSDLVSEIATASSEQSLGINQINQGLTQIDQVIQQNAANAHQSAASSEELSVQAEELQNMLGRFRLKNRTAPLAALGAPRKTGTPSGVPVIDGLRSARFIALDDEEFGRY